MEENDFLFGTNEPKTPRKVVVRHFGYNSFRAIRRFFSNPYRREKRDLDVLEIAQGLLESEQTDCNIDKSKELVRLHRIIENTRARRRLESWSLNVIVVYLLIVLMLVLGSYLFGLISMPSQIMIAILTTTTVNIIGLGLIVLRGHFLANDTEATSQKQK